MRLGITSISDYHIGAFSSSVGGNSNSRLLLTETDY